MENKMNMKNSLICIIFSLSGLCSAADNFEIQKQTADIVSDGIRLGADVYRPKSSDQNQKFPAIHRFIHR